MRAIYRYDGLSRHEVYMSLNASFILYYAFNTLTATIALIVALGVIFRSPYSVAIVPSNWLKAFSIVVASYLGLLLPIPFSLIAANIIVLFSVHIAFGVTFKQAIAIVIIQVLIQFVLTAGRWY